MTKIYEHSVVAAGDIAFDLANPRGHDENQILQSDGFKRLLISITSYGILEPLIVKSDTGQPGKYTLVDGERRLRAALKAKLEKVPIILAENDTEGRILAYQIHMLRLQWDRVAQIMAIKKLYKDLKSVDPNMTEDDMKSKIKGITSKDPKELIRDFKLFAYSDSIIQKIVSKDLDISHLDEIEGAFITKLSKYHPSIIASIGLQGVRDAMVEKALGGHLEGTRSFRNPKIKDLFEDKKYAKEVEKLLTDFLTTKTQTVSSLVIKYEALTGNNASKKSTKKKKPQTQKKTPKRAFEHKPLKPTRKQQTLLEDVRKHFEATASSFSKQEISYITEALLCIDSDCFKAATIMVWASGVDRILSYIERNDAKLVDFNKASKEMKALTSKPYHKGITSRFRDNYASIDDIPGFNQQVQHSVY